MKTLFDALNAIDPNIFMQHETDDCDTSSHAHDICFQQSYKEQMHDEYADVDIEVVDSAYKTTCELLKAIGIDSLLTLDALGDYEESITHFQFNDVHYQFSFDEDGDGCIEPATWPVMMCLDILNFDIEAESNVDILLENETGIYIAMKNPSSNDGYSMAPLSFLEQCTGNSSLITSIFTKGMGLESIRPYRVSNLVSDKDRKYFLNNRNLINDYHQTPGVSTAPTMTVLVLKNYIEAGI